MKDFLLDSLALLFACGGAAGFVLSLGFDAAWTLLVVPAIYLPMMLIRYRMKA
jgi:hypothetical protein